MPKKATIHSRVIKKQVAAKKPFFTWMNTTRTHVFTHVRPEYACKRGMPGNEYGGGMWEHDQDVGKLLQAVKSFAGADERPDTESLEVQPFVFCNLDNGVYLQSTASWAFNLERDTWSIPVGLGVGKLWHVDDDIKMNAFIEPQYTVASEGVGPKWRIFAGINFSYSLEKFLKH